MGLQTRFKSFFGIGKQPVKHAQKENINELPPPSDTAENNEGLKIELEKKIADARRVAEVKKVEWRDEVREKELEKE